MKPIDEIRIEAARTDNERFEKAHPEPLLLLWQVVVGDQQFAAPGQLEAEVREGNTLLHVPRVTPKERIRNSVTPGRRLVRNQRWQPVVVPDDETPMNIGRERGQDCRLNDFTVSARHARIWSSAGAGKCWVEDVESRNGTVHNGVTLLPGFRSGLRSGDELIVGQFVLLFLSSADFHKYLTGKL